MARHTPSQHLVALLAGLMLAASSVRAEDVDFKRDIQPLFTEHCISCHGGDKQRGGLRLDLKAAALAGGDVGPSFIAGKADESELIRRVRGDEPDEIMPPKGKPLSKEQIATLTKWINAGAHWPEDTVKQERRRSDHWSFQPVVRPALPKVKDATWPRNAIDHFILARLEKEGIAPSPRADRYTLIRRVHLDLLGLPPTPDEADAFVKDDSKDAYEKMIDRVLASPHYGERWGRHWLDQARYADSNGYSVDSARTMWPYRDWVIAALNRDMPFDQFTIEQLAGDLLPNATQDQIIATAFHRNTMINQEGGVKDDQFRIEASYDRVATTSQVWLGLTLACAQCHTHKFDPITQKEYYEFFAFFNSTEDSNNTGPTVALMTPEAEAKIATLQAQVTAAEKKLRDHDQEQARQKQQLKAQPKEPAAKSKANVNAKSETRAVELKDINWKPLRPVQARSTGGATLTTQPDQSILVAGNLPANDVYEITLPTAAARRITALRLDVLTHESLPNRGPGLAGNGNFVMTGIDVTLADKPVEIAAAYASHAQPDYLITHAIDGNKETGWAINTGQGTPAGVRMNDNHHAVLQFKDAIIPAGKPLKIALKFERNPNYLLGRFKISVTEEGPIALPVSTGSPAPAPAPVNDERAKIVKEVDALKKQLNDVRRSQPSVMVMRELKSPRPSHIHVRGDFLRLGPPVTPNVPEVLPPLDMTQTSGKTQATRLDLARWLVSPKNPLTPRVTMNRLWMRYFPKGLVETEEDFGTQGALPTHPELLDWLASEFIARKWSMKAMHRLIVTSATYQQASHTRSDLADVDPYNRLLARQSRLRVEAEIIRDMGLAASGLLSTKIGGPSVRPPQPPGVYDFTQNQHGWAVSKGEDRYRRGMYTFFFRSAPYPMLTTFDVTSMTQTCTARLRSNTPLQSLTLANDEAMFEMAQGLAMRVLSPLPLREGPGEGGANVTNRAATTDAARIEAMFRLCLTRSPDAFESQRLLAYLKQQRTRFTADAAAAGKVAPRERPADVTNAEAAAWTAVARVVMNLDEFISRE